MPKAARSRAARKYVTPTRRRPRKTGNETSKESGGDALDERAFGALKEAFVKLDQKYLWQVLTACKDQAFANAAEKKTQSASSASASQLAQSENGRNAAAEKAPVKDKRQRGKKVESNDLDNSNDHLEEWIRLAVLNITNDEQRRSAQILPVEDAALDSEGSGVNHKKRRYDAHRILSEGNTMECEICCMENVLLSKMTQCREGHVFCMECARKVAEGQIGMQRSRLACIAMEGCDSEFCEKEASRFLEAKTFQLWLRLRSKEDIKAANIANLEHCPFCDYAVIMEDQAVKAFECLNTDCAKKSCRLCKRVLHNGKTCDELARELAMNDSHKAEESLTEVLMRRCPKCKTPLLKDESVRSCNKMACTQCNTNICYVCRADISKVGYAHFDESSAGTSTSNKCPLWDDTASRHRQDIESVRKTLGKDAPAIMSVESRDAEKRQRKYEKRYGEHAGVVPAPDEVADRQDPRFAELAAERHRRRRERLNRDLHVQEIDRNHFLEAYILQSIVGNGKHIAAESRNRLLRLKFSILWWQEEQEVYRAQIRRLDEAERLEADLRQINPLQQAEIDDRNRENVEREAADRRAALGFPVAGPQPQRHDLRVVDPLVNGIDADMRAEPIDVQQEHRDEDHRFRIADEMIRRGWYPDVLENGMLMGLVNPSMIKRQKFQTAGPILSHRTFHGERVENNADPLEVLDQVVRWRFRVEHGERNQPIAARPVVVRGSEGVELIDFVRDDHLRFVSVRRDLAMLDAEGPLYEGAPRRGMVMDRMVHELDRVDTAKAAKSKSRGSVRDRQANKGTGSSKDVIEVLELDPTAVGGSSTGNGTYQEGAKEDKKCLRKEDRRPAKANAKGKARA